MTITSVLIANRGEIACRIMRTAQAQGLRTIAVYSEADAGAPHVGMADEAAMIGPGPAGESYLRSDRILHAAALHDADAIHPGYGFLSENAEFARAVEAAGLVFIGPSAKAIETMGNKAEAKRVMIAAGVPCVPGYEGKDQSDGALIANAQQIGFPIMVKAAAGGGGRGMRIVDQAEKLADAISLARSEAMNAFGSGELILEKPILRPRHVEIQIIADMHGNIVHLGERDCSIQRRHQKVIEEAPCPIMTPELRARMGAAAVEAARAVNYVGAGTVEFLLDDSGAFHFLEMNTRLQVEHPVTEMVTGLDLVALQIAIADGRELPFVQDDVKLTGYAIEARLYAEDPADGYVPAIGHIDLWQPAVGEGIRIDAGIVSDQEVSPFYDAMLAKVIAFGETRHVARARLMKAVESSVVLGVKTNTSFLADVLASSDFASGAATTAALDETYPNGFCEPAIAPHDLALAAALLRDADKRRAFAASAYVSENLLGWTSSILRPATETLIHEDTPYHMNVGFQDGTWQVEIDGAYFTVGILGQDGAIVRVMINGNSVDATVYIADDQVAMAIGAKRISLKRKSRSEEAVEVNASGRVSAPMPGLVQTVFVTEGDKVSKNQNLAVLEAMKMQHQLEAPCDGIVRAVHVISGEQVTSGDTLLEIEPVVEAPDGT